MSPEEHHQAANNYCRNCYYPLTEYAKYCPSCGQKHSDGKVTIRQLLTEAWDTLFNFDSKIFRTIGALLIPGRLTVRYFQGKHRRYIHPVRVFIIFAIAFIFSINFIIGDQSMEVNKPFDEIRKGYNYQKALSYLDSAILKTQTIFPQSLPQPASDTLRELFMQAGPAFRDSIMLNEFLEIGTEKDLSISTEDYLTLPVDSLYQKYKVEGFWNQAILRQKIKFFKQGDNFISFIIGKISWGMLLMMPFLALLYMLFYIRRAFYYIEHLIFCLHTHSLVFFLFSLTLLLNTFLPGELMAIFLAISIPLYLIVAMKVVYRQNWLKTILKFTLISMMYTVLITIFAVLVFMASFFLF